MQNYNSGPDFTAYIQDQDYYLFLLSVSSSKSQMQCIWPLGQFQYWATISTIGKHLNKNLSNPAIHFGQ